MRYYEKCSDCEKVTKPPGLCAECTKLAESLGILRHGELSPAFLQDCLRGQGEAFVIAAKMVSAVGDGATASALNDVVEALKNADRVISGN